MNSIDRLIQKAHLQTQEITALSKLPEEVVKRKSNISAWSVLEVIEHLNQTYRLYLPRLREAVSNCPDAEEPQDTYKISLAGRMMIRGSEPLNGKRKWKIRTFRILEPESTVDLLETFPNFFAQHDELIRLMKSSRMKHHTKSRVTSAAGPILRFGLGECFDFLLAHQQRHILQAQEAAST